jgi:hypothetical protein
MNPWQMAQQIKHRLSTVKWGAGEQSRVFGARGVRVIADVPTAEQMPAAFPWAMVMPGAGTPDDTSPDIITQQFSVIIAVLVLGDPMGEYAILGGPVASLTQSGNRGLAEVSERARYAVEDLTGFDGAGIHVSSIQIGAPEVIGGAHVAMERTTLEAICSSRLYYAPPQQIAWDSGTWTWEGTNCSSRWDFLEFRLYKKSGSSKSLYPGDGDLVYNGTAATTDADQVVGNTYTVFASYDARGRGMPDDYSQPEVGSYLVS